MGTKREYAASLGLAVAGARGRLSREAHAAIEKAISEGMTFDEPKPVVTRESKPAKPRSVPKATETGMAGDVRTRYADDQVFVGTDSTGKKRSVNARAVCFDCGYSLTSHHCNSPKVLIGSPLEWIEVRPKGE